MNDVFFLPTLGENFGHIIIEDFIAGASAIISDKKFWNPDKEGVLKILELDECMWLKTIIKSSKFEDHILKKNTSGIKLC